MPKKITIEELAQMVQHGFAAVEKKMATELATKDDLISLEKRLCLRMDNMEQRLSERVEEVDIRLSATSGYLYDDLAHHQSWLHDHEERIKRWENRKSSKNH